MSRKKHRPHPPRNNRPLRPRARRTTPSSPPQAPYAPAEVDPSTVPGEVPADAPFHPKMVVPMPMPSDFPVAADIFVQDTRQLVGDTTQFPWCAICSLIMTSADGRTLHGTGAFIGPRTVLTAGHNILDFAANFRAVQAEVVPGRSFDPQSGQEIRPFQSGFSERFDFVKEWGNNDENFDCGAIMLPDDSLGQQVGNLGFASLTDPQLSALSLNNAGYPKDCPAAASNACPPPFLTMWFNSSRVAGGDDNKIYYTLNTYAGNSGGPVYRFIPATGSREIVGIHTYSHEQIQVNSATRVNAYIYSWIQYWLSIS